MTGADLAWWVGVSAVSTQVDCGASRHRLQWAEGALVALDHPDPDAERALSALGGDRPACLAIVDAWAAHRATPELVTLGRRPGEPTIGFDAPPPPAAGAAGLPTASARAARARFAVSAVERIAARHARRDALVRLLSLPAPFIDRLVLEVMAAAADRWGDEAFRADAGLRVGAALSGRALPGLRRLGSRLAAGPIDVGISPARASRGQVVVAARLEPGRPVVVSADLPVRWLPEVWGRGLSEPGGEFVLDVVRGAADGSAFEVTVAEWEPAGPITWEAAPVPATVEVAPDGRRTVQRHW